VADDAAPLYGQLYLDQDVPVQLAGMLRAYGFDALTTREAENLGTDDPHQLNYAINTERVLVTHNRLDFERLHVQYLVAGIEHCGIVIASQRRDLGQTRNRLLEVLNHNDRDQLRNNLFYV
jgi:hypothetical protein